MNSVRPSKDAELLANIRANLPELSALLDEMNSPWGYEDPVYRFYHQSFKVYALQGATQKIIAALTKVAPMGSTFCSLFAEIIQLGADSVKFEMAHNTNWSTHTRPFLEAFFHARYFLEMAVKYGTDLESTPTLLPSGWAARLCLYDIR